MVLDIYVGSLTSYLDRAARSEWKTYDSTPETKTIPVMVITIPENVEAYRQERYADVVAWRKRLSEFLGARIRQPLDWDETKTTYAVATPRHDGMRALRLRAAYAELPDLELPLTPVSLNDDPAYTRSAGVEGNTRFSQIVRHIDCWLPSEFDFAFKAEGPDEKPVDFGSGLALLRQLEDLNDSIWKATQRTIEGWEEAGLPFGGSLDEEAKYGFSQVFLAAQFARDKQLPMMLDG
jgi:hypothetical protein